MPHKTHDAGISKNVGYYSDAIETASGLRWLYTAGTPGMTKDGQFPDGIEEQSRLAWENVLEVVEKAGMTKADIVKVTSTLTDVKSIPAYVRIRKEMLSEVRPVFMLQVMPNLILPKMLVELEVIAAASLTHPLISCLRFQG